MRTESVKNKCVCKGKSLQEEVINGAYSHHASPQGKYKKEGKAAVGDNAKAGRVVSRRRREDGRACRREEGRREQVRIQVSLPGPPCRRRAACLLFLNEEWEQRRWGEGS